MNVFPIIGFYMRRHEQLAKVFGNSSGAAKDLADALVPVIKKHWPQVNPDGILDDALATLHAATAVDSGAYPDPTQR